jgi:membrane protease YdiL (CAAX protease family)
MNKPSDVVNSNTKKRASDCYAIKHASKFGVIPVVLITLYFYLYPLISLVAGTSFIKYADLLCFFTMSSYTIILLGIFIFHSNELGLFSDQFTLWCILFSCLLHPAIGGSFETIYQVYMNILGVVLLVYIYINRKRIKLPSLQTFLIGLLWAIGTVAILSLVYIFINPFHGSLPQNLATYVINKSVFELSFVTVIEEVFFRGLIFGYLIKCGYKENTSLFVQAIIFWGSHYMNMANPTLFFIIIPLFTLSATLIIKKYKMLYMSIFMHTLLNVFAGILIAVL